jgi:hypothetical protein
MWYFWTAVGFAIVCLIRAFREAQTTGRIVLTVLVALSLSVCYASSSLVLASVSWASFILICIGCFFYARLRRIMDVLRL